MALVVPAGAQSGVRADVEITRVAKGQSAKITKSVYCCSNGRLVVHFTRPEEYFMVTNVIGETSIYFPATNEVLTENSGAMSSSDEMLSLFLGGRADDLGVTRFGYILKETSRDSDGYLVKTFTAASNDIPTIRIVYDNYLPIYCEYIDRSGRTVSKSYYSRYAPAGRIMFPQRHTDITYTSTKDSTVTRTIYSDVVAGSDDPIFDFEVPKDARPVTLPAEVQRLKGKISKK